MQDKRIVPKIEMIKQAHFFFFLTSSILFNSLAWKWGVMCYYYQGSSF